MGENQSSKYHENTVMTKVFFLLAIMASSALSAEVYVLSMHRNDADQSNNLIPCQDMEHCLALLKDIEEQRPDEACHFIDIRKDGDLVYRKFYTASQ